MNVAIRILVGDEHRVILNDTGRPVPVSEVAAEPRVFGPPIDILIGLPNILATAAETECFESHGFERDVPGEDHQVGPRNPAAIFLFDRPEKAPRFIQTDVIRPTVQWSEALLASATAAATIASAISSGAMPAHSNKQRTIVTEVRRPPIL